MKKQGLWKKIALAAALGSMLNVLSVSAVEDAERWDTEITYDEEKNIIIDFPEVEARIPADWSGKCQVETKGMEAAFYHKKSRELYKEKEDYDNGGWMFSICFSEDESYLDFPSCETIGSTGDGYYYLMLPTDVQAYLEDEAAYTEYQEMSEDMDWVQEHISMRTDEGDYILPNSSTEYLEESDLTEMDAAELQMAINEIYARHHRMFVLEDVREYFESKDWYEGTVRAEEFDVSVMNEYESANINLMVRLMNERS